MEIRKYLRQPILLIPEIHSAIIFNNPIAIHNTMHIHPWQAVCDNCAIGELHKVRTPLMSN